MLTCKTAPSNDVEHFPSSDIDMLVSAPMDTLVSAPLDVSSSEYCTQCSGVMPTAVRIPKIMT